MDPEIQIALHPWTVALNLQTLMGDNAPTPSAEVIPPPDANGVVKGRDGRRFRMKDAAALAARINAQAVMPRIDFDHRSERRSPTFAGSTAAEGWLKNARVNVRGGIDADLELSSWAAMSLRGGSYRYLSPALLLTTDMEITGLSSIGMVNDPNFSLEAPSIHNARTDMDDTPNAAGADEREKALAAREKAADERALNAATRAVNQAVTDGKIPAAAKDAHLETIKSHKDGIDAGLNAFEKVIEASAETAPGGGAGGLSDDALKTLGTRVGPAGAPNAAGAAANPTFPTPAGVLPPDEKRLSLHQKIAEYAQTNGVSYRDAVAHFGAMGC